MPQLVLRYGGWVANHGAVRAKIAQRQLADLGIPSLVVVDQVLEVLCFVSVDELDRFIDRLSIWDEARAFMVFSKAFSSASVLYFGTPGSAKIGWSIIWDLILNPMIWRRRSAVAF